MGPPESERGSSTDREGPMDVSAIRRVLGIAPEERGERRPFTFILRNEDLLLSLHLTINPQERSLSLYLRGDNGFLGFLHLGSVARIEVDEPQQQVSFVILHEEGQSVLKIERGGVFALTQRSKTGGSAPGGEREPGHA